MDNKIREMYEKYKFKALDNKQLINYYSEVRSAMQEQIDLFDDRDADFSKAIKLHDELSDDCKAFADELADYCISWHYSDQDIVELCDGLIKEIEGR